MLVKGATGINELSICTVFQVINWYNLPDNNPEKSVISIG